MTIGADQEQPSAQGRVWGQGLSSAEAARRLKQCGANELPRQGKRQFAKIVREALTEPLLLLLIVATLIYFALGDLAEALLLAALTVLDVGLVVYQDYKTERVLESLRELASPRAVVIRDGGERRIPGREVVPGDLIVLTEGDRIVADGRLKLANDLGVDESLLTGESIPVTKQSTTPDRDKAAENGNRVYSGTLVVRGQGVASVTATGVQTELGRIGKSLAAIVVEETPLRRSTRRIARDMAVLGGIISLLVVALYGLQIGDWIAAILAGVTTAMSLLPEEIPIILTVFLTLGAWRISRRHVLTRRVSAIETLGSATVLCTDKTGTLTVNRMSVARLWTASGPAEVSEGSPVAQEARLLIETAALASAPLSVDPMEQAIQRAAAASSVAPHVTQPLRSYGLDPNFPLVAFVWGAADGSNLVAVKGAPEAVAELCHLDAQKRDKLLTQVSTLARDGFRVLAVARGTHCGAPPDTPRGFALDLLGLIGLSDPVRKTVPAAVAQCRAAGIRVVMITGDYQETARAIAKDAGIDASGGVITGGELAALDDAALAAVIREKNVFARIRPEQKLRLVDALKAAGEIVAMTGDGVNDAPALKAAHIGVAMGGRGTDVAREAATLVLLDDAFESIAAAVRLGRRIFDNLRKAMAYVLAVHVPIAGVALAPLVAGWPIVFSPVHIVFLELIIDPICSIAFEAEPEERDVMRRPPRAPRAPLFGAGEILRSVMLGASGLVAVLFVYALVLSQGASDEEGRATAFVAVVAVNVVLVLANRSRSRSPFANFFRPNVAMWTVLGTAIVSLALCLYVRPAAELFGFAALNRADFALALAPAIILLVGVDIAFRLGRISPSLADRPQ
jgi:Ca2+-transporting ATPase